MSGGVGDADLYVRRGSVATTSTHDCSSLNLDNNERCAIPNPASGTWHITIHGYEQYSGVSIVATITGGSGGGGGGGGGGTPPAGLWTVSHFVTGLNSACALDPSGRAFCWGNGEYGQLGDGRSGSGVRSLTPTAVSGNHTFVSLHAGPSAETFCGITAARAAYCWGLNSMGQTGTGTRGNNVTVPTLVSGGVQWKTIEIYFPFACGVSTSDLGYCWGGPGLSNLNGTAGTGQNPGDVLNVPTRTASTVPLVSIALAGTATCGLTLEGGLVCSGNGAVRGTSGTVYSPTPVSVGRFFTSLHGGGTLTTRLCGLTATGELWCWGFLGQYAGTGNPQEGTQFPAVRIAPSLTFSQYGTSGTRNCGLARTTNAAWCWGWGALGSGSASTELSLLPQAVVGGLAFDRLSVGGFSTCGRTTAGALYCWGTGPIGNGTSEYGYAPTPVSRPTQ